MTKEECIYLDLKSTIYHEYGHLLVARHYGCVGYLKIWKNDNFDLDKHTDQVRVLGRAFISGLDKLTDEQRLHVALAGECAAQINDYEHELTQDEFYNLAQQIELNAGFSESDIQLMGETLPDDLKSFIDVLSILEKYWDELKASAEMEIISFMADL